MSVELLESLSTPRNRKFCFLVEDDLCNLLKKHIKSNGRISKMTFPPLSPFLRELIVLTAARFQVKDYILPDGDLEKSVSIIVQQKSTIPCLLFRDFIPHVCPLLSFTVENGVMKAGQLPPTETEARKAAVASDPVAPVSSVGRPSPTPTASPSSGRNARPAMAIYRPRGVAEGRQAKGAAHMQSAESSPMSPETVSAAPRSSANDTSDPAKPLPQQSSDDMQCEPASAATAASGPRPPSVAPPPPEERMGVELDDDECAPAHDYEPYRLDLTTPRGWDDGPRRQAFVELSAPAGGGGGGGRRRWRWDESWMLKGDGNGSLVFTVQVPFHHSSWSACCSRDTRARSRSEAHAWGACCA
jgi:hypothetical protein